MKSIRHLMDREVEAFVLFFWVLILSFSRVDFLRQWDYWMYVGLVIRSITTNKVAYLSVLISSMQPIPMFTCQYPRYDYRRCRSLTEEMSSQIGKSGLVTQSPPREPNYGIFTVSWFEKTTLSNIWFLNSQPNNNCTIT